MLKRKRLTFYISTYIAIAFLAIVGLAVNIKTIGLNDKIQKTNQKIALLKEETEIVWLQVLTQTSLENIDRIAITQLGMEPCKTIIFLPTAPHATK